MDYNFSYESLSKKSKAELLDLAMEHNVTAYKKMNKSELVDALLALSQNKSDSQKEKKQASLWSKYHNHIYGLASLVGLVIAIYALNLGGAILNLQLHIPKKPSPIPISFPQRSVTKMLQS